MLSGAWLPPTDQPPSQLAAPKFEGDEESRCSCARVAYSRLCGVLPETPVLSRP